METTGQTFRQIFKVADIHKLLNQVNTGEISYSRMVEIMNEMAQLPSPKRLTDEEIEKKAPYKGYTGGEYLFKRLGWIEGAKFARDHYESAIPDVNGFTEESKADDDFVKLHENDVRDEIISKQDEFIEHLFSKPSFGSDTALYNIWLEKRIEIEQSLASLRTEGEEKEL